MAHRGGVVNASPLILLRKVERIQLLGAPADQIAVPRGVNREVSAMPDGKRTVRALTTLGSAIIVDDEVPPTDILSWVLGAGAVRVITDAVVRSADRDCRNLHVSRSDPGIAIAFPQRDLHLDTPRPLQVELRRAKEDLTDG